MDDDDKLVVTISLDDVTTVATASVVGTATSEDGTADNDVSLIEAAFCALHYESTMTNLIFVWDTYHA